MRDAVVSSRMEGTISTLEEVLRLEAEAENEALSPAARNDALEVALYARALRQAEAGLREGYKLSETLIRNGHRTMLSHGRGAEKRPGEYRTQQTYIGDRRRQRIDFILISPEQLPAAMSSLVDYMCGDTEPILRTAIAHAEFEALHPFEDGNGRVGRMLIPLMLWQGGVLSAPHFFVADYFEKHKDEYVERLRNISATGDWTGWAAFFLAALNSQANDNIDLMGRIEALYAETRQRLRDILRTRWTAEALDYVFANPIFLNSRFTREAGIPKPTANDLTNKMVANGILRTLAPPSGRAPGLYAFQALIDLLS
jgi:Fic family protein